MDIGGSGRGMPRQAAKAQDMQVLLSLLVSSSFGPTMAPKSAKKQQPVAPAPNGIHARHTVARPPQKQTPAILVLCYVAIPVALVVFLLGCGGVLVLMGAPPLPPT